MANPPKAKGTGGETEIRRRLNDAGFQFVPTGATMLHDLWQPGATVSYDLRQPGEGQPVQVLATRPDRGQWLFTIPEREFIRVFKRDELIHMEVKRYKKFSHHSIFERKFSRCA